MCNSVLSNAELRSLFGSNKKKINQIIIIYLSKEYLKLLGVKWYMIWITWFIRIFSPYMVLSVLFTVLTQIRLYNSKDTAINKATFMQTGKK